MLPGRVPGDVRDLARAIFPTSVNGATRACREAVAALVWVIATEAPDRLAWVAPGGLLANPPALEVTTPATNR